MDQVSMNYQGILAAAATTKTLSPGRRRQAICLIRFDREVTRCCDGARHRSSRPGSFNREFYPTPRSLSFSRDTRTPARLSIAPSCKSIYFLIIGQPSSFPVSGIGCCRAFTYTRSGIQALEASATCSCYRRTPRRLAGTADLRILRLIREPLQRR